MIKHTHPDYDSPTLEFLRLRLGGTICTSILSEIGNWDDSGTDFPVDF